MWIVRLALRRPYTFTVLAVLIQPQLNLFTSQDQLAQSRRDIALDLVALYKALGGGRDVGWVCREFGPLPIYLWSAY